MCARQNPAYRSVTLTMFQPSALLIVWRAEFIYAHMSSEAMKWLFTTACWGQRTSAIQNSACRWVRNAISLLVLAGCTSAPPPLITERPEPRVRKPAAGDSASIVTVNASAFMPGQLRYDFQTFSVTRALAGDSTHRVDSTHVTGNFTTTFVAGPSRNTVLARVEPDSISITIGSGTSTPIPSSEALFFTIDTQTGQVTSNYKEVARDCTKGRMDSSPIYGREVLPTLQIPAVQTWTDTVHNLTCRGGALLTITRVASYTRLQSPDSTSQLMRLTQFHITGNGRQWDQKVDVFGDGTSIDTLRLTGSPPRLRDVTGTSQTKLLFRTELRVQEFIQTSTTHIALRSR